ncbi:MAG: 50S ribosomal protein L24 [Clostridia bacterium]|nr:50S ribosomal protein L24 [Clostridia bacterium]
MKLSVKKGDFVKIIAGSDKGKTAQIIAVDAEAGRVTVEGKDVSQNKKAVKARKASDRSGIINMPKTIDVSNVMPICAACGKAVRVKHSVDAEGKKVRICGKCGAVLETKKKEEKKAKTTVRKRTKKAVEEAPATDATVTE